MFLTIWEESWLHLDMALDGFPLTADGFSALTLLKHVKQLLALQPTVTLKVLHRQNILMSKPHSVVNFSVLT